MATRGRGRGLGLGRGLGRGGRRQGECGGIPRRDGSGGGRGNRGTSKQPKK